MNEIAYQEELLDHYKHPRNKKTIENPDFTAGQDNPSCGDTIAMQGKIEQMRITDLGFNGSGCVISQAAASMLTEHCVGKTVSEVLKLSKDDILALIGIKLGPTRLKCALLSLEVLQQGLLEYQSKR